MQAGRQAGSQTRAQTQTQFLHSQQLFSKTLSQAATFFRKEMVQIAAE
jgi:hypothetical protein